MLKQVPEKICQVIFDCVIIKFWSNLSKVDMVFVLKLWLSKLIFIVFIKFLHLCLTNIMLKSWKNKQKFRRNNISEQQLISDIYISEFKSFRLILIKTAIFLISFFRNNLWPVKILSIKQAWLRLIRCSMLESNTSYFAFFLTIGGIVLCLY